ncbi:MAG: hypothetical protein RBS37_07670 [Bacteroidales bacterium]|jgi:hypothetical protein|nr:hypothetical protein [Bacteroidales bacterium]
MGIPSFFRPGKPKGYNYVPRYYDKEKEEREDRINRIKNEMGIEIEDEGAKSRTGITRGSFDSRFRKKQARVQRNSSIRLLIILLLLFLVLYIFWHL